jgi:hypothetical protein
LRHGYWFYFDAVAPGLVVFISAWSGREVVLINDAVVAEQRNLLPHESTQRFDYQGCSCTVTVALTDVRTRELTCTLTRNGKQIAKSAKSYAGGSFWSCVARDLLASTVFGCIVWLAAVKLGLGCSNP